MHILLKYRTKFVSDDWMIEQGFMEDPAVTVGLKQWFVIEKFFEKCFICFGYVT